MIEKFLTTEQVANILQVHPFTILKFLKEGKLKGVKLGRVYRIKESDVHEFLEERMTKGKTSKVKEPTEKPLAEGHPKETEVENYKIDQNKEEGDQHYYII